MKAELSCVGLLLIVCAARAQAPASAPTPTFYTRSIIDTWELNVEASQFPGTRPQFGLPWQPLDDGEFLIGLPFRNNANGDYGFIFVPSGVPRPRLYAGWPRVRRSQPTSLTDAYSAKFDSDDGEFMVDVTRTDSSDGTAMTLKADLTSPQGQVISYVLVFDRQ